MIAVLGATGRIGRHIAAAFADQGLPARAVVRDPASPAATALPLPAVRGDLCDPASLRDGFDGAEQLLLLTPHGPEQDLREASAIDAARAAGIRRVVKVSGAAATLGPNGTASTAVGHWRTERRIEESGLAFQFLRPSFLMQNLLEAIAAAVARTGLLLAPMGRGQIAMVDARDVAQCAVAAARRPRLARPCVDAHRPARRVVRYRRRPARRALRAGPARGGGPRAAAG